MKGLLKKLGIAALAVSGLTLFFFSFDSGGFLSFGAGCFLIATSVILVHEYNNGETLNGNS